MRAVRKLGISVRVFAITLAVASIPSAALCETGEQGAGDTCCIPDGTHGVQETGDNSGVPADDDCCPGGCHPCFLPCCAGPVSLCPPTFLPDPNPGLTAFVAHYESRLSSAHPGEIFHPPRA
jgi:hypothetical protein